MIMSLLLWKNVRLRLVFLVDTFQVLTELETFDIIDINYYLVAVVSLAVD